MKPGDQEPLVIMTPLAKATDPPVTPGSRTPEQDLEQITFSLDAYRKALGGNPVGSNAEIVNCLLGKNEKTLQLGLPSGIKLNTSGELIDRWGTPYFFHSLSGTEMEIRSAGADVTMWTDDDLIIK
jgi:hypothetical protein